MKRFARVVAVLLGLFFLGFAGVVVAAFAGNKEMPDGQVLPGGAIRVNDGHVSAYLIPAGEKALLVDCGSDPEAKAIKVALQKRGLGPDAVTSILLTHGHPDHIKGCKQFPKAQIYVGAGDEGLVDGTKGAKGPLPRLFGAQPSLALAGVKTVHDGDGLDLSGIHLLAWLIPGHTAGSAAYLIGGALFLGDSATLDAKDALRGAPWVFSDDQAQNVASLRRLGKLLPPTGVLALVPAHSGSAAGGAPLAAFAAQ